MNISEALEKAVTCHKAGDLATADVLYTSIIDKDPYHPDANHNLGLIAVQLNKISEAKALMANALKINKSNVQHWVSFIEVCLKMDGIESAAKLVREAVEHIGDFSEGHMVLANALFESGQTEAANLELARVLEAKPEDTKALLLRSKILHAMGRFNEASVTIESIIRNGNESYSLWNDLGVNKKKAGKDDAAIQCFSRALLLKPDDQIAGFNLGVALRNRNIQTWNTHLPLALEALLKSDRFVNPSSLHDVLSSVLKADTTFAKIMTRHLAEGVVDLNDLEKLGKIPLLLQYLTSCPNCNLEFEELFRAIRFQFLLDVAENDFEPSNYKFIQALCLQNLINEFVYYESEHETNLLTRIERKISTRVESVHQLPTNAVYALALYRRINSYDWSNYLYTDSEFEPLRRKHIDEYDLEVKLSLTIPKNMPLGPVSSKVSDQYEQFPYPRWEKTGINPNPLALDKFCETQKLRLDIQITTPPKLRVLVAGCGTGQQSIHASRTYANCEVLAIDLSLASLAFAKRKTLEYGLSNIEYLQADILALEQLELKKFDVIECSGVLHHMSDPIAGLQKLCELLKTGGLIRLGLYSRSAREPLAEYRKANVENVEQLRKFRHLFLQEENFNLQEIAKSSDFYTLSGLKDLLFHVQESQYDLLVIDDILINSGLSFAGFDVGQIERSNLSDAEIYDLLAWNRVEITRPGFFADMYQFWCQKVD